MKIANKASNRFLRVKQIKDNSDGIIVCSHGTVEPNCELCMPGTYYLNGKCIKCPKGTFLAFKAATSVDQCIPCPSGFYSDIEGAEYCLECPKMYDCPIGSSEPRIIYKKLASSSIQPNAYNSQSTYVKNTTTSMWYAIAIVSLILIFIVILIRHIWLKLRQLDIFSNNHSSPLDIPIVYKKTSIGGFFSLIFLLSALVTIVSALLNYNLSNIIEIKALIPSIALNYSVTAKNLDIDTTFYIYGGKCVSNNQCHPDIKYTLQGLKYSSIATECAFTNSDCNFTLHLSDLEIDSSISSVLVEMKEQSSYASSIGVNITSSSSIPEKISSNFIPVETPSSDYLFKGKNPTIISCKFTPSVFTSESSDWPDLETGFHVSSYGSNILGSLATQNT